MIILALTTDKLQAVLNAAQTTAPMPVMVSYRDISTTGFTAGRKVINTNGVTAVDIVDVPAASTQRIIDYISVYNADTAVKTITIRYNANGTNYTIYQIIIGIGEKLEYQDGKGWTLYTIGGQKKLAQNTSNNVISGGVSVSVLAADVINNNGTANTIADVTGLSFPVTAGKRYWFKFIIPYTANATTTGSRWSINNVTTTLANLIFRSEYSLTTTTKTFNEGLTAVNTPAASNATSAAIAGNIAIVEGFLDATVANGSIIARFASEVLSAAITAKAGAIVLYQELN